MNTHDIVQNADFETVSDCVGIQKGKKKGRNIPILCPAHNDKSMGNCFWFTNSRTWKCFACGEHGNLGDLVSFQLYGSKDGKSFVEAVKQIAEIMGFELTDEAQPSERFLAEEDQVILGLSNKAKKIIAYDEEGNEIELGDIKSPLYSLYKENNDEYKRLVKQKYEEKFRAKKEQLENAERNIERYKMTGKIRNAIDAEKFAEKEREDIKKLQELKKKYKIS